MVKELLLKRRVSSGFIYMRCACITRCRNVSRIVISVIGRMNNRLLLRSSDIQCAVTPRKDVRLGSDQISAVKEILPNEL